MSYATDGIYGGTWGPWDSEPDTGADLLGWWRDRSGTVFEAVAYRRAGYVESRVPGDPLASTVCTIAQACEHVAAGRWTRAEAPVAAPAALREHNRAAARAAEASPPNVRGLLLFGQRKGPTWERFRVALAAEVERCNCRAKPETLTRERIEAIARESVRED